jgi:hypothetical protein
MHVSEFNTSKRKPALDTSDEFEASQGKKPTFKRLRSENNVEPLPDDVPLEELKLLASVPAIQRLGSGRQIDNPVQKTIFWDRRDSKTYHLAYPEMTQLQLDVFRRAAREKGEEFVPGDSGLWKLAMKYFPPNNWRDNDGWEAVALNVADSIIDSIPDSIPDTLPPESQQQIIVPDDLSQNRLAGVLESPDDSLIKDIHLPISDSILSWGRGLENTHVFEKRNENMVPKYAFKILVWKEGYDAARDRGPHPWHRSCDDEAEYHFYISTKATNGIWINDYMLQSHDSKKPSSPSHHWVRLCHGDELVIWGSDRLGKAKVTFKCFWGGSRVERDAGSTPEPVHVGVARRLDEICLKAERRYKSDATYKEALDAHCREHALRGCFVEKERARSDVFETKRRAAKLMLAAKNVSRRGSPSSAQSSGGAGY